MKLAVHFNVETVAKDGDDYRVEMSDTESMATFTMRGIRSDLAPYFGQAIGRRAVKVTIEVEE